MCCIQSYTLRALLLVNCDILLEATQCIIMLQVCRSCGHTFPRDQPLDYSEVEQVGEQVSGTYKLVHCHYLVKQCHHYFCYLAHYPLIILIISSFAERK